MSFIVQFIAQNWGLEKRQAYNYIKSARKEWQKYFAHLKGSGMSYHVAQLRDLKDQAYSRKVIIGKGDNKEMVTIADLGLVFEITKEEAKLMGLYVKKKEVGPPGSFAEWVKAVKEEKERRQRLRTGTRRSI